MEQQKQKKEWKTPELIVLVRGKPEEAVLAACKKGGMAGPTGSNSCKTTSIPCDINAPS
jgi:hypothetical protein